MSVLVDTSVWIRFLANRAPFAAELDGLLSCDDVIGHDFVHGELLVRNGGGRGVLLANYERMDHAPLVPHAEVVAFVRDRRLRQPGREQPPGGVRDGVRQKQGGCSHPRPAVDGDQRR